MHKYNIFFYIFVRWHERNPTWVDYYVPLLSTELYTILYRSKNECAVYLHSGTVTRLCTRSFKNMLLAILYNVKVLNPNGTPKRDTAAPSNSIKMLWCPAITCISQDRCHSIHDVLHVCFKNNIYRSIFLLIHL